MIDTQMLLDAALAARQYAYAPYSHFAVGAALLDEHGTVFVGCNIENAAFSETCCAERVAIFKAISSGSKHFKAIAVVGAPKSKTPTAPCLPCGSCRQVLAEFCDDNCAVLTTDYATTLGSLLPKAFRLSKEDHV